MTQFADSSRSIPLLEKVLVNPAVPVPRKRAAVADVLGAARSSTPIVSKLLALLADRDRLVLLPEVSRRTAIGCSTTGTWSVPR